LGGTTNRDSDNNFPAFVLGYLCGLFNHLFSMNDGRKIIVIMFAATICTIMLTLISSFAYYGPGSGRKESVDIVGNLVFAMLGVVITYVTLNNKKNEG